MLLPSSLPTVGSYGQFSSKGIIKQIVSANDFAQLIKYGRTLMKKKYVGQNQIPFVPWAAEFLMDFLSFKRKPIVPK